MKRDLNQQFLLEGSSNELVMKSSKQYIIVMYGSHGGEVRASEV